MRILPLIVVLIAAFPVDALASNGLKPPAATPKSYGRGGVETAWPDSALSMLANPASIIYVPDEQVDILAGVFTLGGGGYSDSRNSGVTSAITALPFGNLAFVFDLDQTEDELMEELRTSDPVYRELGKKSRSRPGFPTLSESIFGSRQEVDRKIVLKIDRMPRSLTVLAQGKNAVLSGISVVANYSPTSGTRFYSHILASRNTDVPLDGPEKMIARFTNLVNPLPDLPQEIVVYYHLRADSRGKILVRVLLDGREEGEETADSPRNEKREPERPEFQVPRFRHELQEAKRGNSSLKFGIGVFAQSGAQTELTIATELYPEGADSRAQFALVSLTPTIAFQVGDLFSFGATLQLSRSELEMGTPVTQDPNLMQGEVFPPNSLDGLLTGAFGVPSQFGPAMKYTLNTSDTHAPGTTLPPHTAKENDPLFSSITGKADIAKMVSYGAGARFGFLVPVSDRLMIGLTWQTPSFLQNFQGKAKIDFNRLLEAMDNTTTQGHSNYITAVNFGGFLNINAEARFTFNQVWEQGVIDIYSDFLNPGGEPQLLLANQPLPSGSIKNSMPNGGVNGFTGEYDLEIVDFQMPQEISLGMSYRLFDWMTVGFDYRRIFWSQTMKSFKTKLTNGTNPDVNYLVGSPDLEITLPLDWNDQDVIALGAEFQPLPWLAVRAGWNWGNNPVPAETLLPILPAITEHHASFGASAAWGAFSFDFAFMHSLEKTVHIGTSRHGRDLDNSRFSVSQNFITLGMQYDF